MTDHATEAVLNGECGSTTGDVFTHPPIAARQPAAAALDRLRRVWSAGDYDRISAGFREGAAEFVTRRQLRAGQAVLDAACGTGNLTIPAARTGGSVTGLDLVPSLLAAAGDWAAREALEVRLVEGPAESMPLPDAQFDVVLSMFGIMFASQPDRVVQELERVTRPGGVVALANWTPTGFIGRMLRLHTAMVPPPAGAPSPLAWGDPETVRTLFDPSRWRVTTEVRTLTFDYPHTPRGTAELFRGAYGPTVRTFEALDEDRRAAFATDLAFHWESHQKGTGARTRVDAEYLEVVAVKR